MAETHCRLSALALAPRAPFVPPTRLAARRTAHGAVHTAGALSRQGTARQTNHTHIICMRRTFRLPFSVLRQASRVTSPHTACAQPAQL